jgi:hypothetical protein
MILIIILQMPPKIETPSWSIAPLYICIIPDIHNQISAIIIVVFILFIVFSMLKLI